MLLTPAGYAGSPLSDWRAAATTVETRAAALTSPSHHLRSVTTLNLTAPNLPASVNGFSSSALNEHRVGLSALPVASATSETRANATDSDHFAIHWQSHPDGVDPEVVRLARNYRHEGLPVVHLWQSGRSLLHIGLSPHGVPGIYFTQKMAE
jgi:hypothetical protein